MEHLGFPQVQYAAKNFGPIRYGEVSLAPLTIFTGPNGSGKTYMATLIYLLTQAVAEKEQNRRRVKANTPDEQSWTFCAVTGCEQPS
jgi:predicted ATPase